MSQKEIDRLDSIKRVLRKEITGRYAAELLHISERQVWNLVADVRREGAQALIHGNRGKKSNRCIPKQEKKRIIKLLHERYTDFGPTFATEKLTEEQGIIRDPKTVRAIMIDEGLWKPKRKKKSQHRSWRQRKATYGEMQQFDGSYEHWFEDRGPRCCLLVAIDDATSIVTHAAFVDDEGVEAVFAFWKQYLLMHGKPCAIYLDKFSTYNMNSTVAQENHDIATQFERALLELRVEKITAHSPEAKGRVERLFRTLQDRLIKEMRLKGIANKKEGNAFLKEYIPKFNAQFGVDPTTKGNMHKKLTVGEEKQLDAIFSRQYTRTVLNDYTVGYNKQWYQLTQQQPATVCAKDKVIVEERLDGSVHIRLRGKYLNYTIVPKRPGKKRDTPWVIAASTKTPGKKQWKPAPHHPWRQYEKKQSYD